MTPLVALVWLPGGIASVRFDHRLPRAIRFQGGHYAGDVNRLGELLVERGRHSGCTFAHYRPVTLLRPEQAADVFDLPGAEMVKPHGDGEQPSPDRSARAGERRKPATTASGKRRGHLGRSKRGATVQGR